MTADLFSLLPPIPESAAAMLGEAFGGENEDHGTGGDRMSLALRPVDEDLILAVAEVNPRTVVALVAAGAVMTETWRAAVPGVVMMWYAGMEGGHALADVVCGAQNPSGRLPFSIPTSEEHLPSFDRDATTITYDHFHGQRLLDRLGARAAFPHGFGLSYTTYEVRRAEVRPAADDRYVLSVEVANTGTRDGTHVVQVYGRSSSGPYAGELTLVGFAPVRLGAGATVTVEVEVSLLPLGAWDPVRRSRVLPPAGDVELEVGAHAHDPAAAVVRLSS
jgi:beta-glucosidase